MAITNVIGFDNETPREDKDILTIMGSPLRTRENYYDPIIATDPVIERNVLRLRNNRNYLNGHEMWGAASTVFKGHHTTKTRWFIGYRFRYDHDIASRPPNDGCGIEFSLVGGEGSTTSVLMGYDPSEIGYYLISDRYTYHEVCLDWEQGKFHRWIDGYQLPSKDIPQSMIDAEDFYVRLGVWSSATTTNAYYTDIYFLVDTKDNTPCDRLGGARVRSLEVASGALTDKWENSVPTNTPAETLNADISSGDASRLEPYLLTSNAENASVFKLEQPTLDGGKIQFVQVKLNAYRKNGATPVLHANTKLGTGESGERDYTMYVDDIEGREVAELNLTPEGNEWTPGDVAALGVEIHSTSGGA